MTEIIFVAGLCGFVGYIAGKLVKGFNPFLLIFALAILLPMGMFLTQTNNLIYTTIFILGFSYNYGNPLRRVGEFVSTIELRKPRFSALEQEKQRIEQELHRQKAEVEEDLRQQKQQAEDEIQRQRQAAEQVIREEAENLRKEREKYRQQQERAKQESKTQSNSNQQNQQYKPHLNPRIFEDACEILQMPTDKTLKEYKKAYLKLMKIYHVDKLAGLSDELKRQEEEKAKLINVAWETIQKHFR